MVCNRCVAQTERRVACAAVRISQFDDGVHERSDETREIIVNSL